MKKTFLFFLITLLLTPNTWATQETKYNCPNVKRNNQSKIKLVNDTTLDAARVPSYAKIEVMNQSFYVCSYEPQSVCPTETSINVPSNEKIKINLSDFIIETTNRDHHLNIDNNCKNIIVTVLNGESKTIHIKGYPSNWIDRNTRIVCHS
jgi:hypothetical protein